MSGEPDAEVSKKTEKLEAHKKAESECPKKNEMTDLKFFEFTRAQIQHEDTLINNRVTWLLTLQAFLFAAYGFSLGAQSTLETAQNSLRIAALTASPDNVTNLLPLPFSVTLSNQFYEIADVMMFISRARIGFAIMSLFASEILLFGIGSAAISMKRLVNTWAKRKVNGYPQIIGRISLLGSLGGLLPTYGLPVATAGVWYWLVRNEPGTSALLVQYGFYGVVVIALIGLVLMCCAR